MARRLPLALLAIGCLLAALFWPRAAATPADAEADAAASASAGDGQLPEPAPVERAAIAPAEGALDAGEGRLLLRVLDAAGRPAPGARIAQLDFGAEPAVLRGVYETDARGEAEASAWSAELATGLRWVVAFDNHAPLFTPAAAAPGIQELRLLPDAALAGAVRVDGAPPGEPLRVEVRGFRDPAKAWPAAAREVLTQWGLGDGATVAWVAPDGCLALHGLPAGEVLELVFPAGFVLLDDASRSHPAILSIVTPALDLQVELTRLPAIRGILVQSKELTVALSISADSFQLALPNLLMTLEWTLERGGAREEGTAWLTSGQSFNIPLPGWNGVEPERAELRVRDLDGSLLGWRELRGPLPGGADLGTWTVPDPERVIQVTVLDERGQPVAGAAVVAHRAVSGRTEADGRARLVLHAPPGTLTIGAFGYRLLRVPVPEPAPAELSVHLESASRLRLEVREPDDAPAEGVVAVLSYSGALLPDAPEAVSGFESARGPASGGAIWSDHWHEHHYPLPQGVAEWSDLPEGAAISLQVRDVYDNLLHEESLLLSPFESRQVQVRLPRAGRLIAGRIVTPAGAPIAGATAYVGGMFMETRTGADGRFELGRYYGEAPGLILSAEGRVSLQTSPADFVPGRDWILEPARSVWIEALDARGVRAHAGLGPLLELDGGWKGAGQERGPGLYEVPGAPFRPGVVTVPGTQIAPVRIGADQTALVLTVPD